MSERHLPILNMRTEEKALNVAGDYDIDIETPLEPTMMVREAGLRIEGKLNRTSEIHGAVTLATIAAWIAHITISCAKHQWVPDINLEELLCMTFREGFRGTFPIANIGDATSDATFLLEIPLGIGYDQRLLNPDDINVPASLLLDAGKVRVQVPAVTSSAFIPAGSTLKITPFFRVSDKPGSTQIPPLKQYNTKRGVTSIQQFNGYRGTSSDVMLLGAGSGSKKRAQDTGLRMTVYGDKLVHNQVWPSQLNTFTKAGTLSTYTNGALAFLAALGSLDHLIPVIAMDDDRGSLYDFFESRAEPVIKLDTTTDDSSLTVLQVQYINPSKAVENTIRVATGTVGVPGDVVGNPNKAISPTKIVKPFAAAPGGVHAGFRAAPVTK